MLFFFSSRRRHTRFDCDWSSDVCSSDLSRTDLERRTRLTGGLVPRRISEAKSWGGFLNGKLAHASELIILERLLDFRPAVHHEWAVADDRLCDWFAVHHKELGLRLC